MQVVFDKPAVWKGKDTREIMAFGLNTVKMHGAKKFSHQPRLAGKTPYSALLNRVIRSPRGKIEKYEGQEPEPKEIKAVGIDGPTTFFSSRGIFLHIGHQPK